ncbi:hypothetical protein J6590_022894 [Homalodisca vitripennis]|nr:hypothetical protein J6590_022894 [Homalodisca vitripennis]
MQCTDDEDDVSAARSPFLTSHGPLRRIRLTETDPEGSIPPVTTQDRDFLHILDWCDMWAERYDIVNTYAVVI